MEFRNSAFVAKNSIPFTSFTNMNADNVVYRIFVKRGEKVFKTLIN